MNEGERAWQKWAEEHGCLTGQMAHWEVVKRREAFLSGYAAAEEQVCRRLIEEVDKIEGVEGGEGP